MARLRRMLLTLAVAALLLVGTASTALAGITATAIDEPAPPWTASTAGATASRSLIKKVKRVGHGFCSFANYRLRLLLHCGVTCRLTDHKTARTLPTLVA
jgi:hypothetical protein